MQRHGPAHPGFGPDRFEPIGEPRYEAQVFTDMLLADQAHRHNTPRRDRHDGTKKSLGHEDAFGMMAKYPMPKIR